jgi:PAS domain S-box-containing protein
MSGAISNTTDDAATIDSGRLSQTIVRETPEAIIYADTQGIIRFWNLGAERVFGFAEAEALGQSLDIIIPEGCARATGPAIPPRCRAGARVTGPAKFWRCRRCEKTDGASRSSSRSCRSGDGAGRMEGIAAILRDVTVRFEETRALRRQLAERSMPPRAPAAG